MGVGEYLHVDVTSVLRVIFSSLTTICQIGGVIIKVDEFTCKLRVVVGLIFHTAFVIVILSVTVHSESGLSGLQITLVDIARVGVHVHHVIDTISPILVTTSISGVVL